jgi:Domain of unknown function (DUF4386)
LSLKQVSTTKRKVNNDLTAVIVGILYIIGTIAGILSMMLTRSPLSDPNNLTKIESNKHLIVMGAILVLTMALALAMVPIMLYPILRKYNDPLAMGYVIFRGALEPIPSILVAVSWLLLILVSRQYIIADPSNASFFQNLSGFLVKGSNALNPIVIIIFSLDALMLYFLFYQSRLIPRWIPIWGFIFILLHLSTAFLILFDLVKPDDLSTLLIFNFSILIQEMVMAVWLIARGFNASEIASASAQRMKTAM